MAKDEEHLTEGLTHSHLMEAAAAYVDSTISNLENVLNVAAAITHLPAEAITKLQSLRDSFPSALRETKPDILSGDTTTMEKAFKVAVNELVDIGSLGDGPYAVGERLAMAIPPAFQGLKQRAKECALINEAVLRFRTPGTVWS